MGARSGGSARGARRRSAAGGAAARLVAVGLGAGALVLSWAPVWVPLVLLWQVATLGFRPSVDEGARLERERIAVEARYERTRDRYERMRSEVAAWSDPLYRERVRRLIEDEPSAVDGERSQGSSGGQ